MTCGAVAPLEDFLPFISSLDCATTNFNRTRSGVDLPVSGVQGSRYPLFRLVHLWGTPPELGVALDEASIEGVSFCELSLVRLNYFGNINGGVTHVLYIGLNSLVLLTNLISITVCAPNLDCIVHGGSDVSLSIDINPVSGGDGKYFSARGVYLMVIVLLSMSRELHLLIAVLRKPSTPTNIIN